jgi:hypothetical protein
MKVAVVIYEVETNLVLCGLESYYCFEESEDSEYTERLHKLEYCSELDAIKNAIYLSKLYDIEIRYTQFLNNRTHYSCLTSNSHWGIVKGNGYKSEEPLLALKREIYEEVGINVPQERFIPLKLSLRIPTYVYLLPITSNEKDMITNHIEELRQHHSGELFQLGFRHLNKLKNMNYITRRICEWMLVNKLPNLMNHAEIKYSPLIPISTENDNYSISYINEPPFKWGKKRYSILPLP